MTRKSPRKSKGVPFFVCFWVDAVKQDELNDGETYPTPEVACTCGFIAHQDAHSMSFAQEVFTDGNRRNLVTVPREMIKALVKVGVVQVPPGVRAYIKAIRDSA